MAKFEYKTHRNADKEIIDADSYNLDTKVGKLTFYNAKNDQLASFATEAGAYVKRLGQ